MPDIKLRKLEEELVLTLKPMLDKDANFVKPLSEFWKGATKEMTLAYGHYGLWLSGEGGSMIDGEFVAEYYNRTLSMGHPILKTFMKDNNLKLVWHDCGTPILLFKDDFI